MKERTLEGRIAVLTGASAGIGQATARHLAQQGAKLVVNARREEKLAALQEELKSFDSKVVVVAGDCSEMATIEALFEAARSELGGEADLVVANAGRGLLGSVLSSDESQWAEVIQTNYLGVLRLMRAAGELMCAQAVQETWPGRARDIIVLGSSVGRNVSPFSSMYGSTKAAVHSLAEGVRRELGPKGVRVTLIEPAIVESEFQGVAGYDEAWKKNFLSRFEPVLQPEDVARSIVFVAQQPTHVHINDISVRPTRQDYP